MARIKVEKNISFDDVRKVYYATFNFGTDANGKTIRQTKTFDKVQDAKKALKEFEIDKIKENVVFPKQITLNEYIDYWINDIKAINCEVTTLYGYRNIIENHVKPYFNNVKLQAVSPYIINKYFSTMSREKNLSNNTIKKHYNLLFDVFKTAVSEDKIIKNPLEKVEKIKVSKREQNCYDLDQMRTLLNIVENDRMDIVIRLAGLLGLRREEIAGLKWSNVDFKNKELKISEARTQAGKDIVIKDTKSTSSYRILSIPEELETTLLNTLKKQQENKQLLKDDYKNDGCCAFLYKKCIC